MILHVVSAGADRVIPRGSRKVLAAAPATGVVAEARRFSVVRTDFISYRRFCDEQGHGCVQVQ